ncbi:alpha/beta fold hydrolase [Pseudonocardia sp. KRD291]|uniref:alpha/beta fold hydrolase n=1 Tax=Pseudonocardia sp. KRD291 TaxID=2792007 RepID=UPI001C49E7FC|nr:alpha/beta hydrolase [Pseudonocardia sp. KRD291]MBW0104924.1 alpha/beta fold hydrolase [Pseudonocardia sp. KRD291]
MTTFVLVPGFWLGAWAWDEVAAVLRGQGHHVVAVTPAGMAERRAGKRSDEAARVTTEDQVEDLVTTLRGHDGDPVVLVGHSGGGPLVAAAVERGVRDRVAALVFVDTGPLPGDVAHVDFVGPEQARLVRQRLAENGGEYPMPTASELGPGAAGIDAEAFERIRERSTPEPGGVVLQAARRAERPDRTLPKIVIACTFTADDVRGAIGAGVPAFAEMGGPEWSVRELPTGHWPMFSEPAALARLLAGVEVSAPAP